MTSFGFATICFSICLVVALLFQLQLGTKKDLIRIEPFPKVTLVSPFQSFLFTLKQKNGSVDGIPQVSNREFFGSFAGANVRGR
jgi:hypothetical protein